MQCKPSPAVQHADNNSQHPACGCEQDMTVSYTLAFRTALKDTASCVYTWFGQGLTTYGQRARAWKAQALS